MSISTKFTQFVSDNVEYSVCELDGSGTFHGMGIIVCLTNVTKNARGENTEINKDFQE